MPQDKNPFIIDDTEKEPDALGSDNPFIIDDSPAEKKSPNATVSPDSNDGVSSSTEDGAEKLLEEAGGAITEQVDIDLPPIKKEVGGIPVENPVQEILANTGLLEQDLTIVQNVNKNYKEQLNSQRWKIDGEPVLRADMKDKAYDPDFIQKIREGQVDISIKDDPELEQIINKNVQAGSKLGDKWNSLYAGVADLAAGAIGIDDFMHNVQVELLGMVVDKAAAKEIVNAIGISEKRAEWSQEKAKEFLDIAQEEREKTFQYNQDFIEALSSGNFSDAADIGLNVTAESLPISLTAMATGGAPGFVVMSGATGSAEYQRSKTSTDEGIQNLTNAEKLLRSGIHGIAEGGSEALFSGPILRRSFNYSKDGIKYIIQQAKQTVGEEAAQEVSEEFAKASVKRLLLDFGIDAQIEGMSEAGTEVIQRLTDVYMGVAAEDYELPELIHDVKNAYALGVFSGKVMAAPGATSRLVGKSFLDSKLREEKEGAPDYGYDDLAAAGRRLSEFRGDNKEEAEALQSQIKKRKEAVRSVPNDVDTETVDLAEKKNDLEEKLNNTDEAFAGTVQQEIEKVNAELSKKATEQGYEKEKSQEEKPKESAPAEPVQGQPSAQAEPSRTDIRNQQEEKAGDGDGDGEGAGQREDSAKEEPAVASFEKKYPKSTEKTDGLLVREEVPNQSSIGSTLSNYETLPGIRDIPLSEIDNIQDEDSKRVSDLAKEIEKSQEISPLIVVVSKDGTSVLEGRHRIAALKKLGKKTFPAKTVIDSDSFETTTERDAQLYDVSKKYKFSILDPLRRQEIEKQKAVEEFDQLIDQSGFTKTEILSAVEKYGDFTVPRPVPKPKEKSTKEQKAESVDDYSPWTKPDLEKKVTPIRQLGTGSNVYFETDKYRVNEVKKSGKFLLSIDSEKFNEVPAAQREFDTAEEAVYVAEQFSRVYPKGAPEALLSDKVIDEIISEYSKYSQNELQEQKEGKKPQTEKPKKEQREKKPEPPKEKEVLEDSDKKTRQSIISGKSNKFAKKFEKKTAKEVEQYRIKQKNLSEEESNELFDLYFAKSAQEEYDSVQNEAPEYLKPQKATISINGLDFEVEYVPDYFGDVETKLAPFAPRFTQTSGPSESEITDKIFKGFHVSSFVGGGLPLFEGENTVERLFQEWVNQRLNTAGPGTSAKKIQQVAKDAKVNITVEKSEKQEKSAKSKKDKAKKPKKSKAKPKAALGSEYASTPISDITLDEQRFQNREKLDEKRVDNIIENYDERLLDPIVIWEDSKSGNQFLLSGHHRYAALQKLGKTLVPTRTFIGTEQEAIDFARDSNTLGKSETPIERANRYRQLREDGMTEQELYDRARTAHGKDASFIINISRLDPRGKATGAVKQFMDSSDRSMRSKMEAIADWIGALKKYHPDVSRAQENEMFEYLLDVYSPKKQRGAISNRNQFVELANHRIDKMKSIGEFNEDSSINLRNATGKGPLELEYDEGLALAKQNEADARRELDTKRKEFISRNASPTEMNEALKPYEDNLRKAIEDLAEVRKMKNRAIEGDKAQMGLFDTIADEPILTKDERSEQKIEQALDKGRIEQRQAPESDFGGTEKEQALIDLENARKAFRDAAGGSLQSGGLSALPEFINLVKAYVKVGYVSAKEFIKQFRKDYPDMAISDNDLTTAFEKASGEVITQRNVDLNKPKKTAKRYAQRQVQDLKELRSSEKLQKAIKAHGLEQEKVPWLQVHPLAQEIVDSIFSVPEKANKRAAKLLAEYDSTTNADYDANPQLTTLHSLIFHMMVDRFRNMGDVESYAKWSDRFQKAGASAGRRISAMQHDASPYAVKNLQIRPVIDQMVHELEKITDTGVSRSEEIAKIQALTNKLIQQDELIEKLQKKVEQLAKEKGPRKERSTVYPAKKLSSNEKENIRKKRKRGFDLIKQGIKKSRGQANVGIPINDELIQGIRLVAESYIEEGVYELGELKRKLLGEIEKNISSDKEFLENVSKEVDKILSEPEVEKTRKEAINEAFSEALVNRAKNNLTNPTTRPKTAVQSLLDSLLGKMNETTGRPKKEDSKNYLFRIREAILNAEITDDVWKTAISNVKAWLDTQPMSEEEKAKVLADMEDAVSEFMDKPFTSTDMRKAIRSGVKDLGQELSKLVKQHWSEQNQAQQTIAEKIIYELGLTPEEAAKYQGAIEEEVKSLFDDKKRSEMHRALNLDRNGMSKEQSERVNKRIVDRMLEHVNLGMLDNDSFRSLFAEKYGFVRFSPKDVRTLLRYNDLINLHQDTDMSKRYMKEMMDYVETLKPYTSAKVYNMIQTMTIRGMLTGLNTNLVNIPFGSFYAFGSSILPTIMANPAATAVFVKEYSDAGLSGMGRRLFRDIMRDNYSPLEEGHGSKFDEREIYGDPIDHLLNSYDLTKLWDDIRNAKSIKDAAKSLAVLSGTTYLQAYRLANYAKAFDVLLSVPGSEFDMFLNSYQEEAAKADASLRARFDPTAGKQFMEAVRKRMGYDLETRTEITQKVDAQIAAMKARGERVGPSFKQTLIREQMLRQRNDTEVSESLERVRSFLLMEQPTGILGMVYDYANQNMTIQDNTDPLKGMLKLSARMMFGLFLRITVSSAQRGLENIPGIGLAMPGIFYDVKKIPENPDKPQGKSKWEWGRQDAQTRNKRLMTHAMVASLTIAAGLNMFDAEDDEELQEQPNGEFERKKVRRWKLNPDRIVEVTGFGGDYYKTEQFSKEDDRRKDYYFRLKIGDKWHNVVPLRLAPHFMFPVSVLGGMRDDILFNPVESKERSQRELIMKGMDDLALGWSEMSFATIPKNTKKIFYASQREPVEGGLKVAEIIVKPMRSAIYPNAYKDTYLELQAFQDQEKRAAESGPISLLKDIPVLDNFISESEYDAFGYPKKTTSKLLTALEDVPAGGIVFDHFIDNEMRNEERFDSPVWKFKQKYFPYLELEDYRPRGLNFEAKMEASRLYGEHLRGFWEDNMDVLSELNQEQMMQLMYGKENHNGKRSGGLRRTIIGIVKSEIGINDLASKEKEKYLLYQILDEGFDTMSDDEKKMYLDALNGSSKSVKELTEKLKK